MGGLESRGSEICMKQHDLISELERDIQNKENIVARQGDRNSYACKTRHGQVWSVLLSSHCSDRPSGSRSKEETQHSAYLVYIPLIYTYCTS